MLPLSSYTKDMRQAQEEDGVYCHLSWKALLQQRVLLHFPGYSGLQLAHSTQVFPEVDSVCACTATDHFPLLFWQRSFCSSIYIVFQRNSYKGLSWGCTLSGTKGRHGITEAGIACDLAGRDTEQLGSNKIITVAKLFC